MAVRRTASFAGLAFAATLVAGFPAAGSSAHGPDDAASIVDGASTGAWAGIIPSHVPPAPPTGLVPLASRVDATATLPRWTGGVNLYRTGVFSTQKTWIWCTAAGAQISRNIVLGRSD